VGVEVFHNEGSKFSISGDHAENDSDEQFTKSQGSRLEDKHDTENAPDQQKIQHEECFLGRHVYHLYWYEVEGENGRQTQGYAYCDLGH